MQSEEHLLEGRPGGPWRAGRGPLSAVSSEQLRRKASSMDAGSSSCQEGSLRQATPRQEALPPLRVRQGIQRTGKWSPGSSRTVELRSGFCGSDEEAGSSLLEWGEAAPGCREGPERRKEPESQRGPPEQPDSWCLWSRDIREKVLEHVLHWYFLTSEWVWRWARRLERSAKARLQWGQEKGFSPGERQQKGLVEARPLGRTADVC